MGRSDIDVDDLHHRVLDWYRREARDLPWRGPDVTPWGVLVSEVMLQQTPVARVLPVWLQWMQRWPSPAALASDAPADAVRAWDRLGYPRRALRLHAAAAAIVATHHGEVPADVDALRALPGVGAYTAAAVAAFGFGASVAVLDTNVRRVHARLLDARSEPSTASPTVAEQARAEAILPDRALAPAWSVAVMELGALICTAKAPRCEACPVQTRCAWTAAGRPAAERSRSRSQPWAGTDRQVRGRMMAILRDAPGPLRRSRLDAAWHDAGQRRRCLASLLDDGLVVESDGWYALPGEHVDGENT